MSAQKGRFVPHEQRKREWIQSQKTIKKGPLATFLELQDDPSLIEALTQKVKIRSQSETSVKLDNVDRNSEREGHSSASIRKKTNGIIIGTTASIDQKEKKLQKPILSSKSIVYISEPNLNKQYDYTNTAIKRSSSAPVVGAGVDKIVHITRRSSSTTKSSDQKRPSTSFPPPRPSLPSASSSSVSTRKLNKFLSKWSLEREKRSQLIQKLSRPSTGSKEPQVEIVYYSAHQPEERNQSVAEMMDDVHPTVSRTSVASAPVSLNATPVSKQVRIAASAPITKPSQSIPSPFNSPSKLPISAGMSLKAVKKEQEQPIPTAILSYAPLPIRRLQLLRNSLSSRSRSQDPASIVGLDINQVVMHQPIIKSKPVVSKPEKVYIVDLGSADEDDVEFRVEMKPYDSAERHQDEFL